MHNVRNPHSWHVGHTCTLSLQDLGEFADKENTGPVMEPGGVFIEIIKENASKPVPVGSEPLKEQMLPLGDTGVPTEEAEVEVGSRIPFAKHRTRTATS